MHLTSRLLLAGCLVTTATGSIAAQNTSADARVTVVDNVNGTPLARVAMTLDTTDSQAHTTWHSDGNGIALIPSASAVGVLTVAAPGFATTRRRWPPVDKQREVVIRLDRASTLTIKVMRWASGAPASASALVFVSRPLNPETFNGVTSRGVVEFDDVPEGPGVIVVKGDGLAPSAAPIVIQGRAASKTFYLHDAGVVVGTVTDANGSPVNGATITVRYPPDVYGAGFLARMVGGRTRTGTDGRFRITGILPNTPVDITAHIDTRRSSALPIVVPEGQPLEAVALHIDE
jgi:hypothetical protein